jgi:hypothetical protein
MKPLHWLTLITLASACRNNSSSTIRHAGSNEKHYRLTLRPGNAIRYAYDLDKDQGGGRRDQTTIYYQLNKDSAGSLLFDMQFDSSHLYRPDHGVIKDIEASPSMDSILHHLMQTHLTAIISPLGTIASVSGYGTRDMESNTNVDETLGANLSKESMGLLFPIYPDDSVAPGDQWIRHNSDVSEFGISATNTYTLDAVDAGIASISVHGQLSGDSAFMKFQRYPAKLNGKMDGKYELEIATGMLKSATITLDVSGTINVFNGSKIFDGNQEFPFSEHITQTMHGRKLN